MIEKADLVIHHGGNNSFTECLYYGKPAIIMPYCWDGRDIATRVQETGHGRKLAPDVRQLETERKSRSRLTITHHRIAFRDVL